MLADFDFESKQFVQDKIRENISNIKYRGNRWNFRCPICGDSRQSTTKARGNYYANDNSFHCFNCGAHYSGTRIVTALFGMQEEEVKKLFYSKVFSSGDLKKKTTKPTVHKAKEAKRSFVIPNEWIELEDQHKKFLEARRIFEAPYLGSQRFFWNITTKRIVIPFFENGKIIYYQERAFFKGQDPKYRFPANTKKQIFGLDKIDPNVPYIFFMEGVFDSIFVKNGISVGGIFMTEDQEEELRRAYPFHELIWLPDNPGMDKTAKEQIDKRFKTHPKMRIFVWRKNQAKDINDEVIVKNDPLAFSKVDNIVNNLASIDKYMLMLKLEKLK
ncbi:MAG TPA: hypothetical protein PLA71_00290 [Saccharofermentans sp.]|nr:hypothetical protein [Saccharofermentans sp.]